MISQEVRELAAGIADDIERYGHFQGGMADGHYWSPTTPTNPCCIRLAPSAVPHTRPQIELESLLPALEVKGSVNEPVVNWNDRTPTAEVLAALRKVAAGEKP